MVDKPCISHLDSITQPGVHVPKWLGLGVKPPADCRTCGDCTHAWSYSQIKQWVRAVDNARREVERFIGSPLCPTQICDEIHRVDCPIHLKHTPVSTMGLKRQVFIGTYDVMTFKTAKLHCNCDVPKCVDDGFESIVVIPIQDTAGFETEDLIFTYHNADCKREPWALLDQPCLEYLECEGDVCFISAQWERIELADPRYAPQMYHEAVYICQVDVYAEYIDESMAVVPLENCDHYCNCGICDNCKCGDSSELEWHLAEPKTGELCLKGFTCGCDPPKKVAINYVVGLSCYDDPSLVEAIVKIAVTKLVPEKMACSCDEWQRTIEHFQEVDPSAGNAKSGDLRFGPTMGGMSAWRSLMTYTDSTRPSFAQDTGRAGLFGRRNSSDKWSW